MDKIYKVFVEKRDGFDVAAKNLYGDIMSQLDMPGLTGIRAIVRYYVSGIDNSTFDTAKRTIFGEPNADIISEELELAGCRYIVRETLAGTYDQRADSAEQCIKMLSPNTTPKVIPAMIYVFEGNVSDSDMEKLEHYLINPVEARLGDLCVPTSLDMQTTEPMDVAYLEDFCSLSRDGMEELIKHLGLAMSINDAMFVQEYYKSKLRNPTITEIKVIDTYWSDHCRHTTFMTRLDEVKFVGKGKERAMAVFERYLSERKELYGERIAKKPVTLMDIGTIAAKMLKAEGEMPDIDVSEEINACSIIVDADVDGKVVPYLFMFKNETHNHPTEIEPFGGAATCLGGAIRDPLSGRAYVHQAMRVTGCADPTKAISETIPGKLPQRAITVGAAAGYSSYGNQIGLATGHVSEVYHEGYAAKRMEIGAVIAAAPKANVVRECPIAGDRVLLVGGRTGRDGCGGATGASKAHNKESLATCGAEVQKGNPLTERKIQRLFRIPELARLIKRCNDFGAGGVSVAVGELSDGVHINLDMVPKKYNGLDGTELAISESQERMAVVVAKSDVDAFMSYARRENLECTEVAEVTDDKRMVMTWRGKVIVDIERDFLDTNGVISHVNAVASVDAPQYGACPTENVKERLLKTLSSLNVCSERGLIERFDSTIGANTVLMPMSGKFQRTQIQAMAAKLPTIGFTNTGSVMAYGFDPYISENSPFHGAIYAVMESLARIACAGADIKRARLTFQEYFEKLGNDEEKWGNPLAALLGAYLAQRELHVAAIGGKDSMSGTFMDIHVPPTLVSFAVAPSDMRNIISRELKRAGDRLIALKVVYDSDGVPDFENFRNTCAGLLRAISDKKVVAASTVEAGGIMPTVAKMCFGNGLGADFALGSCCLFRKLPCSIIVELAEGTDEEEYFGMSEIMDIGVVTDNSRLSACNEQITLDEAYTAYTTTLESVFATQSRKTDNEAIDKLSYAERNNVKPKARIAKPHVLIPVFPGTNCEYDSERAFIRAGASVETLIIRNTAEGDIEESLIALEAAIKKSQIIMLPGGFSAGDEPDGSAKFTSTVFRAERVKNAITELLENRDGLMLGICNGFQTLIKLGLVPFGRITETDELSPTLTYNSIGRHQSRIVRTRISSVLSPWLSGVSVGDIISVPISHGEGRIVCPDISTFEQMKKNGQIATQYVDESGTPTYCEDANPPRSFFAIEGITSPDGRVFGKMGHAERWQEGTLSNVEGNYDSKIFVSGVKYFE